MQTPSAYVAQLAEPRPIAKPLALRWVHALPLAAAVGVGAGIRLIPAIAAGTFPPGPGGLFLSMSHDVLQSGFALPNVASFNGAGIPFTYPPLMFYALAALEKVGLDPLWVMQWGPALLATLTIPAVFLVARGFGAAEKTAGVAALSFAVLPPSTYWLVEAAGWVRAAGMLLTLLAIWQGTIGQRRGGRSVAWAGVLGGLAALAHPEAPLFVAAGWAAVLFADGARPAQIRRAITTVLISCAVVSPWLLAVVSMHGIAPLLSASGTHGSFSVARIAVAAAAIAASVALSRRYGSTAWLVPGLWLVLTLCMPGDRVRAVCAPLAILSAVWIVRLVVRHHHRRWQLLARGVALGVLAWMLIGDVATVSVLRAVTPGDLQAIAWVEASSPTDASFAFVTTQDPVGEWFPPLSGRRIVGLAAGLEWVSGPEFTKVDSENAQLQACWSGPAACLETVPFSSQPGYVWVPSSAPLASDLAGSSAYRQVYGGDGVSIFARRPK